MLRCCAPRRRGGRRGDDDDAVRGPVEDRRVRVALTGELGEVLQPRGETLALELLGDQAVREANHLALTVDRVHEERDNHPREREREERRGVVYGLVVTGMGEGGVMPVETIAVPGDGRLKLTGSLGDVIKESGELALSWVKTHAYELCITNSRAQDPLKVPHEIDVHLHLPSGAVKKDGPSAGIAMVRRIWFMFFVKS